MANITALTCNNTPPTPSDGGPTVHFGQITLAAAQIADVVRLCVIPAGAKVYDVALINAALGASVTGSVGYAPVDGVNPAASAAAFIAAGTALTAAAKTRSTNAPVKFDYDVYLTLTIAGAAATGLVDGIVEYESVGLK